MASYTSRICRQVKTVRGHKFKRQNDGKVCLMSVVVCILHSWSLIVYCFFASLSDVPMMGRHHVKDIKLVLRAETNVFFVIR